MPDPVLSLEDITQQISRHESQLERLRRQYEARQAQLADLAHRKEELQVRFQQVEAEIEAVTLGSPPEEVAHRAVPKLARPAGHLTLRDMLVEVVRAAGGPVTVGQLAVEVVRRRFPTTSRNIPNLVSTRVKELVRDGIFRRAPGQPGVSLGKSSREPKVPVAKPKAKRRARRSATKKAPAGKPGQPLLRATLTELLKKSRQPLAARELAAQALAGGYQTKSKNLTDVVWTALGQMKDVENVPGKGYRLKQRRA